MDNQERIYRYLHDEMSASEQQAFEEELKRNGTLNETLNMEKSLITGIQYYGREQFKLRVQKIMQRNRRLRTIKLGLATLFILASLLTLFWYFFTENNKPVPSPLNAQQLFAAHYVAPDLGSGQRSGSGESAFLNQLRISYRQGEYESIVEQVDEKVNIAESPEVSLILGLSMLEVGDYQRARKFFLEVRNSSIAYYDHAQWYDALALIAQGNFNQAREILEPIAKDQNHDHHEDAVSLLEKM